MIFTGAVAAYCKAIAGAMAEAVLPVEVLLAVVMGLVAGEGGAPLRYLPACIREEPGES